MSESYKNNRIKFNKVGAQKAFILKAKDLLGLKVFELAQKLNISQRTLADWTREKITISQISAQALSKFSNIPIPKNYSIIDWKTHFQKAGKIGGKNKFKLYGNVGGDEIYRKNKWREWWKTTGQFKKNSLGFQTLIKIKIPKKNLELAEFTGIMLGDGGIAPYYIHITLSNTEKAYIGYVMNLINRLFDVHPKLYKLKYAKAVDIVIQRKKLVDFCQQIGLVLGNKVKHQVDIPEWVKNSKEFSKACIRGLIDTDGCFYTHSYFSSGKKYFYFKIAFTSASRPLVSSVAKILGDMGIKARITNTQKDVRIESNRDVLKYIEGIGSNNQKHLEKIKQWKNSGNMLK